jgi:drug/metabolite transporter (DMT)-like permease
MLAAALWGVAGTAAKYFFSNQSLPPFLLVQVRLGLSSLLLLLGLVLFAPRLARIRREDIGFFVVWGVLGMAMVQFTYLLTISETNVATAIFLQSTAPVLTALYAVLFERKALGGQLITCLGIAMAGSFLLISGGTTSLLVSPLGLASGLASAFFLSFYTIYAARHVADRVSPWTLLGYGLGIGFLFWLLVDGVLAVAGHPLAGTAMLAMPSMWLFFFYIALPATVLPFGLYLTGLKWVNPTQATITGMLEPVVGGLTAYFILGEVLRPIQLLGGGLIVGAVVLLQTGKKT